MAHTSVYAATYYVSKISSTFRYKSGTWPIATDTACSPNDIDGCLTTIGTGNTLILDGGSTGITYTNTEIDADGGLSIVGTQTLRGPISTDPDFANHGGIVTLDGTGGSAVIVTFGNGDNNSILSNLTITNQTAQAIDLSGTLGNELTGVQINDIIINGGVQGIIFNNYAGTIASPIVLNRIKIINTTSPTYGITHNSTNGNVIFNYLWYENNAGPITFGNKIGTYTLNNPFFIGNPGRVFYGGAGTAAISATINNGMVVGNGYTSSTTKTFVNSNSNFTITVNNSNILPNPISPASVTWDTIIESNNIYRVPMFKSHRRSNAVVSIVIDDLNSLSDFADFLVPILGNFKASIAIGTKNVLPANYTTLAGLINAGYDVLLHSDSHARLTDLNGPVIQYVGAGSACTVTVNAAGTLLTTTVTGGGGGEDLSIDLTNANYDRINEICAYIDGLAAYTCTNNPNNYYTKSTSLQTVTAQAIKAATYTMFLDGAAATGRYYVNEITNAKATLEAGILNAGLVWTARAFIHPQDYANALTKTAVINAGLLGSRSDYTSGATNIYNLDVTNIRSFQASARFGTTDTITEAALRRNIAAWVEWLGYTGGIGVIYGHTMHAGDYLYNENIEDWTIIIDELAKSGITVKTLSQAISDIRTGADHNIGNVYYSCATETDSCIADSSNYHLQSASPAINTGVNVGLSSDYEGNPIVGLPDIGAYEYQSAATSTNNNISTSTTISSVCNDTVPGGKAPWLYGAIAQDSASILLYFTEADNPVNKYVLTYGTKSGDYQYGVQDMGVNNRGQMTFLVKSLSPNTTYYFRVRGGNGCATGSWSNEFSAKTKSADQGTQWDIPSPTQTSVLGDETSTTDDHTTVTEEQKQEGYDVNIKVIDTNKTPVAGAKVTIHSKVQETITNAMGVAHFSHVESGDHTVLIAYAGYSGDQQVTLSGNVKEFNLNIQVKPTNKFLNSSIIGFMGIVIVVLVILLVRTKFKSQRPTI